MWDFDRNLQGQNGFKDGELKLVNKVAPTVMWMGRGKGNKIIHSELLMM